MQRARDWWVQAEADLRHACHALEDADYEWACFAAQQAAEKALKAVFEHRRQQVWGHSVTRLLQALEAQNIAIDASLLNAAKVLDKLYIPTRYPNGLVEGAPTEFFTHNEAEHAIRCAETILRFCHGLLSGSAPR